MISHICRAELQNVMVAVSQRCCASTGETGKEPHLKVLCSWVVKICLHAVSTDAPNFELIVIYRGEPAWDVRAHCVINLNIVLCMGTNLNIFCVFTPFYKCNTRAVEPCFLQNQHHGEKVPQPMETAMVTINLERKVLHSDIIAGLQTRIKHTFSFYTQILTQSFDSCSQEHTHTMSDNSGLRCFLMNHLILIKCFCVVKGDWLPPGYANHIEVDRGGQTEGDFTGNPALRGKGPAAMGPTHSETETQPAQRKRN